VTPSRVVVAGALGLIAAACDSPARPEEAAPDATTTAVTWAPIEPGATRAVVEAPARLVATATASAEIAFLAAGTVRRVFVQHGDAVEVGTPVLQVASPELAEAAGAWRSVVERLAIAQERLQRLETLASERIASQDELQARKANIARLRGQRRELRGRLLAHGVPAKDFDRLHRTGRVTLASPVTGSVTHVDVQLGRAVQPGGPPLVRIVGAGRPRVEAMLEQRPVEGLDYTFVATDGERFAVRSKPIASIADPTTGTWTTWFELDEATEVVGERVGELWGTATGDDVFTLPMRALRRSGDRVFVARTRGEGIDRVRVEVLSSDERVAVVRGPLSIGDEVALDPTVALDADGV